MKILITGSEGQVGRALAEEFKKTNHDILALNRSKLDITNKECVKKTLSSFCPSIIINTAAYTSVDLAEDNKEAAYAVNTESVSFLAQQAQERQIILIHLSTDYVFSGKKKEPYLEEDQVNPCNFYGKTKQLGEEAIASHCQRHIIIRTSWIFGEHGHNFVKSILNLAKMKTTLSVVDDQIGAPTYSKDLAQAILKIVDHIFKTPTFRGWGTYHYSGSPYVTWAGFAQLIGLLAYKQNLLMQQPIINKIPSSNYPTIAKRPKNSCLNYNKIASQFGISPSDWKTALNDLKAYF